MREGESRSKEEERCDARKPLELSVYLFLMTQLASSSATGDEAGAAAAAGAAEEEEELAAAPNSLALSAPIMESINSCKGESSFESTSLNSSTKYLRGRHTARTTPAQPTVSAQHHVSGALTLPASRPASVGCVRT